MHAGFSGFRAFVACDKSWCKLIENHFVLPHDTIPKNVTKKAQFLELFILRSRINDSQLPIDSFVQVRFVSEFDTLSEYLPLPIV